MEETHSKNANFDSLLFKPSKNAKKAKPNLLISISSINKHLIYSQVSDYDSLFEDKTRGSYRSKASASANSDLLKSSSKNPASVKQKKIEKMREEKIRNELKECTFSPKILNQSKARTPKEYYEDQMRFKENTQKKIENIKEQLNFTIENQLNSLNFVPNISEKSSEIASKILNEKPAHERLFQSCKGKTKDLQETSSDKIVKNEFTFTPNVNSKSKNLLRSGPVEEILYEDAKRRQKKKEELKPELFYEANVNSNSEKFLIEKFYKEFLEICDHDNISLTDLDLILRALQMTSGTEKNISKESDLVFKLWQKISNGQMSVTGERVLMYLMAIMNYQTSRFTDSSESISPEETESLHMAFLSFYESRNSFTHASRSCKVQLPVFRPEISKKSRKILEEVAVESIAKKREIKKMEVIQEIKEQKTAECTFRPVVQHLNLGLNSEEIRDPLLKEYIRISQENHNRAEALYSYAEVERKQKEDFVRFCKEKNEEKELADCTFSPNIARKEMKNNGGKKSAERGTGNKSGEVLNKNVARSGFSSPAEKEYSFREWENRKIKEIQKIKIENENRRKVEMENQEKIKRKNEEEKKNKYEKLKEILNEKKMKLESRNKERSKVLIISTLPSDNEDFDNDQVGMD